MLEKNYEDLGNAVIVRAVKDYKRALRAGDPGKILALERFFRSSWGRTLMGDVDPEYIIQKIRRTVK